MREIGFARAWIVSIPSLPFPLSCRGHITPQKSEPQAAARVAFEFTFPGSSGEAGARTQVSIHASASLRTRLCTEVLKTFSQDGRSLERESERTDTGKKRCRRSRESCKLCNLSLLCKLHVGGGKVLSLLHTPRQAVLQSERGVPSGSSAMMGRRKSLLLHKDKRILNAGN